MATKNRCTKSLAIFAKKAVCRHYISATCARSCFVRKQTNKQNKNIVLSAVKDTTENNTKKTFGKSMGQKVVLGYSFTRTLK
jgi:hypothetical protein